MKPIAPASFFYFVQNNKMVLCPVNDSRQGDVNQLLKCNPYPLCPEAQFFSSITYCQQRYSFTRLPGQLTKSLQIIMPAKIFGNNPEARRATIHRIGL